ncbi:MAG: hypothetical protein ACLUYV_05270 [Alistipes shahii]
MRRPIRSHDKLPGRLQGPTVLADRNLGALSQSVGMWGTERRTTSPWGPLYQWAAGDRCSAEHRQRDDTPGISAA